MRLLARRMSKRSYPAVLRSLAALGLAATFGPILPAQAQDAYPDLDDIGLVMRVHTKTVEPNMTTTKNPFFAGGGPFSILVDVAARVADLFGRGEDLVDGLDDFMNPNPSSRDLLILIKDDRMRVDMGTSSLLARLDEDGAVLEWGVLDPGSGRVVDSELFDVAVKERSSAPYDGIAGGADNVEVKNQGPTKTDEIKQIADHTARRYDFSQMVRVFPLGTSGGSYPMVVMKRSGQVWIAEDGRYVNDPAASAVSHQFIQGMPSELVRLTAQGLVLGADDESTISTGMVDAEGSASGIALDASSPFRVTSISREVVDETLFAGFEQDKQACDCSCSAFEALKKLDENDPNAMGKAMCAQKCTMKWVQQCVQ
jgi:hypothetical protein